METTPWDVLKENCPTRDVFARLGERWTPLVILALEDGPQRFNALRRQVEGVTQKMLTQTLRGLERDGLVQRAVFPTVPVTVEYSLTPLGATLLPVIHELRSWAYHHIGDIQLARNAYASRSQQAEAREAASSPSRSGSGMRTPTVRIPT